MPPITCYTSQRRRQPLKLRHTDPSFVGTVVLKSCTIEVEAHVRLILACNADRHNIKCWEVCQYMVLTCAVHLPWYSPNSIAMGQPPMVSPG